MINKLSNYLSCLLLALTASVQADERIISTDAFVTELIFALGLEQQLVAVDVTSALPTGFEALPNIGYHRNLSAEGLLSLKPSVVIGSEHMGPEQVIQALTAANVTLLQLGSAESPRQLQDNIMQVARALDHAAEGDILNRALREKLARLANQPHRTTRIAFLLNMDPSKLRLAGRGTSGAALIHLLGAQNVGEFKNYQNVSAESLLAMQPDVILVAGQSLDTSVSDLLATQDILQYSAAGRNNRIMGIDGSTLVAGLSISAIDEALRIAQALSTQP